MLEKSAGPKMDEVTGGIENLLLKNLQNFRFSPDIVRMKRSKQTKLAGRVASMENMKNKYGP
jgi:hypothetical protein